MRNAVRWARPTSVRTSRCSPKPAMLSLSRCQRCCIAPALGVQAFACLQDDWRKTNNGFRVIPIDPETVEVGVHSTGPPDYRLRCHADSCWHPKRVPLKKEPLPTEITASGA